MENRQEILLTQFNEILSIRKPRTDDSIDGAYADLGIGIHKICKSTVCSREISETHRAIFCKGCGLRIVIPKEIDTYAKLNAWCQEQIAQQKKQEEFTSMVADWIKYLHRTTKDHETRISFFEMRAC